VKGGVYTITAPSGNQYVGSSVNIAHRWTQHRVRLRRGEHPNAGLQAAWNKYSEEEMAFAVVLVCSRAMLLVYEQIAIDGLKPKYNVRRIAASNVGVKLSAETRARMSATRVGKKHGAEARRKVSVARKGLQFSDEHLANLRRARAARGPASQATREKLSASAKAYWAGRK
jgi:group I intron endonuclease